MAIGESAGLLFKIRGDSSDAVNAIHKVEGASDTLNTTTTALGSSFASLVNPATLATGVVSAIGTAAFVAVTAGVQLTRTLFDLSKTTSEFGSEIFDASQKTGLSAETLSAMKFAADQSNTSLEAVTDASAKFARTIQDAANGSEKAQAKLDRLGVTSKNLDVALKEALATIIKLPPGIEQMTAAQDAFGRSGANLLPFIKSFDGDLDNLVKKAKEFGVTINNDAARAADEFGDTLDTLGSQVDGVGRQIGTVFLPIFTHAMLKMSELLVSQQDEIQAWANRMGQVLLGVEQQFSAFSGNMEEFRERTGKSWSDLVDDMLSKSGPLMIRISELNRLIGGAATGGLGYAPGTAREGGRSVDAGLDIDSVGGGRSRGSGGRNSADREAEREERERVQQIRTETQQAIASQADRIAATLARNSAELAEGTITERNEILARHKIYEDFFVFKRKKLNEELEAIRGNAEAQKRVENDLQKLELERLKVRSENRKEIADRERKINAESYKEQIDRQKELLATEQLRLVTEERKLAILQQQGSIILPGFDASGSPNVKPEIQQGGIFDAWTGSFKLFYDTVMASGPTLSETLNGIANIAVDAFGRFAEALGSVVEQWVLTGNTGPAVMRKILAAALASIAAESAVRAIYELALGFATLFTNPAESGSHFVAAALFGGIAGVAALAGRTIAPTSEASGAFASATAGTGAGDASGQTQPLQFTERFNGFQRQLADRYTQLEERVNATQGFFADALEKFTNKFEGVAPGHVVMAGAQENPEAIRGAMESELQNDLRAATNLYRFQGAYR